MNFKHSIALAALSVFGLSAQAAIVGQLPSPVTLTTNNGNLQVGTLSAAQTGDLYIELVLQHQTGAITANDFVGLWLDNVATGDHTDRPNIGLKTNMGLGATDYFVRGSGTEGSFAPDQAAIGSVTTLWGHLYKSGAGNYNRFDLWVNAGGTWSDVLATTPEARSTLGDVNGVSSVSRFGFRTANLGGGDSILVQQATIFNSVPVSAVPEPGSLALMGLGLGLMGFMRRRAA